MERLFLQLPKAQYPKARKVHRPHQDHEQLVALISTLTAEVERLDDDNTQLRAAVDIYREIARRSTEGRDAGAVR